MSLWHDIDPKEEQAVNVIIEINKGSKNKYEIDKKTGLIALDRVTHTSQDFPFDYGFIPQTLWHDGDPVDVIVLSTHAFYPGILVRVRPVALLNMNDGGHADDKIIAVPTDDPRWNNVQDLEDINKHTLKEIDHFYSTYKKLQEKVIHVGGFQNKKEAERCITEGIELYKREFKK